MDLRGRRLEFTAVTAIVVLALTGFSTGRGHGHSGTHDSGGGGGGGCSSSSQDHDNSSSTSGGTSSGSGSHHYADDDDDGSYGSGSGSYEDTYTDDPYDDSSTEDPYGDGESLEDGTAKVVSCATVQTPYTTVRVTNPNDRAGTFNVRVAFRDEDDYQLDYEYAEVEVPANGEATVRVKAEGSVIEVSHHCDVDPLATPVS